jgi:hypothetical protein
LVQQLILEVQVGFAGRKIFELNGSLEVLCQQLHRPAPDAEVF